MRKRILKIQKSYKPIWETKLSINGIVPDNIASLEQSYEMIVNFYSDENGLPDKTITVSPVHYESNISKYGMKALLNGIKLTSLFDAAAKNENQYYDRYKKEVEMIAHSIVAKMEQDTFFNHYNPGKMVEYIEDKLLSLKDKFNIQSK